MPLMLRAMVGTAVLAVSAAPTAPVASTVSAAAAAPTAATVSGVPAAPAGPAASIVSAALAAQGGLTALTAPTVPVASASEAALLHPYVARYKVRYRGLSGGVIEFNLHRDTGEGHGGDGHRSESQGANDRNSGEAHGGEVEDGVGHGGEAGKRFIYESRAFPSVLGRLMISKDAREKSVLVVDANGVRPLSFVSNDGSSDTSKDSNLKFDWEAHRLTGRALNKDLDVTLPDRTQDHLSIQIAIIADLLQNRDPGTYSLVDDGQIKQYQYTRDGTAKINFKGKDYDAVIMRSSRGPNSRRTNRYWQAVDLGYLPLRAERSSDGSVDLTLDLEDVQLEK